MTTERTALARLKRAYLRRSLVEMKLSAAKDDVRAARQVLAAVRRRRKG